MGDDELDSASLYDTATESSVLAVGLMLIAQTVLQLVLDSQNTFLMPVTTISMYYHLVKVGVATHWWK